MGIQFRRSGYDVRLAIRISSGSGMDPGVNRMNEPGTISIGENSVISIDVEGESYRIGPEETRTLLSHSRTVPVYRVRLKTIPGGSIRQIASLVGHATISMSGWDVLIFTPAGYYTIPLLCFRKIASGETVSASLRPISPDHDGDGINYGFRLIFEVFHE